MHPFRFAATSTEADPGAFVEQARRAEDLGYSTLSISDHMGAQLAPLVALAAASRVTTTLRLATVVLANDFRHPAILAKEAATLDQLSDGRLELGIGAGWLRSDYESSGLAYDRPGVRIARLTETIEILRGLFAGEPYSFEGEHYRITGLAGTPLPRQRPHPPFLVAGGSPKILALAAQEADIVGLNPSLRAGVFDAEAGPSATPEATDEKVAWVRDAAGDRFDAIELHTRVHLAAITDDAHGLAGTVAPALGLDPETALTSPHALVGTVDECVERVLEWRERWGISYVGISGDAMDSMAPVVARLAGT